MDASWIRRPVDCSSRSTPAGCITRQADENNSSKTFARPEKPRRNPRVPYDALRCVRIMDGLEEGALRVPLLSLDKTVLRRRQVRVTVPLLFDLTTEPM